MDVLAPIGTMDVLSRLCAAAAVGALIGVDREVRGKPAGLRTHALVSLGAALVTIVAADLTTLAVDRVAAVSRVIQGIIAGVGFLGGGVILKSAGANEQESVHGLTTAATIWIVAALGIAAGAGQPVAALIVAGLSLLILIGGYTAEKLARRIFGKHEP